MTRHPVGTYIERRSLAGWSGTRYRIAAVYGDPPNDWPILYDHETRSRVGWSWEHVRLSATRPAVPGYHDDAEPGGLPMT